MNETFHLLEMFALIFMFWYVARKQTHQSTLARRVLELELRDQASAKGPSAQWDSDVPAMLALLKARFPELNDPKKMVRFLGASGVNMEEMGDACRRLSDSPRS